MAKILIYFLLFVAVFCVSVKRAESACPTGALASINGESLCYSFISTAQEFIDAEQVCVDLQGHLASVSSGFVNAFLTENGQNIFKKVNASDFWIGGSDLTTQGVWSWTDNSNFTYNSWGSGQPATSSGLDCVSAQLSDGTWSAVNCFGKKAYVCEIPLLAVAQCPSFCDSEWAYFKPTDSCYKNFFNSKWNDAENACVEAGAHLVSIHDNAENSFVAALGRTGLKVSTPDQSWIGLYTDTRNTNWNWTDGSPVDFYNWASSQPDNAGKENCVEIFSDNSDNLGEKNWYERYNNYDCNKQVRAFVCKKPANKC